MHLANPVENVMVELPLQMDRPSQSAGPTAALGVVRHLLTKLHENAITYCHWKSNEHVGAGLQGLTDLDILVDRSQSSALEGILVDVGYKRFVAPPLRRYPAIEDFLGYDEKTGRMTHLHLHYELTVGEPHLKGYRLPWEAELLRTRRFDSEHGIFVAHPAAELVLLLVRTALKRRWRDLIKQVVAQHSTTSTSDFQREYDFLRARVDKAELSDVTLGLLGSKPTYHLEQILDSRHSRTEMGRFASAVRTKLQLHRTYGRMGAALRRCARESQWLLDGLSRRYLHHATPRRRISPRGGTVIVLLGSDGAGKSTQSKVLIEWLGKKLDVIPIYFGSGDGPSAIYRLPLRWGQRLIAVAPADREGTKSVSMPREKKWRGWPDGMTIKGYVRSIAHPIWALVLALEKRGKIRQMVCARNRGMVVVCDRFPQSDIAGFNDGPLLQHWQQHRWRLCRWLAAWELQPYAKSVKTSPDVVVRLIINPAAARQRRPEMSLAGLERRVAAIQSMGFSDTTMVFDVDAEKGVEDVSKAIKSHIWNKL